MPSSIQANTSSSTGKLWKDKFLYLRIWCKIIVLGLNILYIVQTFENAYNASKAIAITSTTASSNGDTQMQDALLWQNVIQIIMSCLLMLCLIGDITVLTTRKLSVANWYWRPGLIFCGLTAVNETIILSDALVNSVTIFGNCHQRLISTERTFELIDEICYMQMSLSFIFTMGSMIKAISLSIVYAVTAYFQNRNTIHELKREASTSDMPLENMTSYYSQY